MEPRKTIALALAVTAAVTAIVATGYAARREEPRLACLKLAYRGADTIIAIPGGAWVQREPLQGVDMQRFAQDGWNVVVPRYTLGTESQPCGMQAVRDVLNTVAWVRRQSWCDGRVYLYGESAGGHLALLAACLGARVDGIIAVAAPTDITIQDGLVADYYHYLAAPGGLERLSPVLRAGKDMPPALLIHCRTDGIVPVAHAYRMQSALALAGVECQINIVEGEHVPPPGIVEPIVRAWLEERP